MSHAHIAFAGLLLLLSTPLLVQLLPEGWISFSPLKGYQEPKALPEMTWEAWQKSGTGQLQNQLEAGLNEHLALRPVLIRLNNQVKFDLFQLVNARYTIYGKNGYYFSRRDIEAYQGKNAMKEGKVKQLLRRLACVRDTLQKQGTDLLFVIAPSKARFYPELIPPPLSHRQPTTTNVDHYLKWLDGYDLPHLNYGAYLETIRDSAAYPIYAKGGYHWTAYGVYLAADTLLRKLAEVSGRPMPDLELQALRKQVQPEIRDHDIGEAANLLYETFTDTLAYPEVAPVWKGDPPESLPRVLTIGDSYYSDVVSLGLPEAAFAPDWEFWYYHRQIRVDSGTTNRYTQDIPSLAEELPQWDLILLVITELNLGDKGWKFIDQAFEAYYPVGSPCEL